MLSLVGIIVGLALLIFLAFRGKSLLWAAPVCALLVAFTGGLDMFTAYTQNYMEGMVGFVKEWFPAFMLGAIFGQIMQDSGGAVSLTKAAGPCPSATRRTQWNRRFGTRTSTGP